MTASRAAGWDALVSARSGETEDDHQAWRWAGVCGS
ncbi:MAG: hypothetical protein R3E68_03850 [Burkholderiaceae bacterium]